MPRARKRPEPKDDNEELGPQLRPEEEDFLAFLDDIGPNTSFVDVYRMLKTGDLEWLDMCAFDLVKDGGLVYVRDTYGPGKYMLKFKDTQKRYRGQKTLLIGALPVAPQPQQAVVNNTGDQRFQFLMERSASQEALVFKLIEGLANRGSAAPASDPAAMLTAVVTAFSVLKGASDPTAAPSNPAKQLRETLEIMREAKDLVGGGGEAKEENMYTVLKELGNKFIGGQQPQPGPQRQLMPVQTIHPGTDFKITQLTPNGQQAVQQQPQPAAADPTANAMRWIQTGLAYLMEKFKLGKEVSIYQDLIFDHQEEPQFAALLQGIEQGATFENLLQFAPEIEQTPGCKEWFQQLYDSVRKEIFEPVDPGGPGRNTDNADGNATPGAGGLPQS